MIPQVLQVLQALKHSSSSSNHSPAINALLQLDTTLSTDFPLSHHLHRFKSLQTQTTLWTPFATQNPSFDAYYKEQIWLIAFNLIFIFLFFFFIIIWFQTQTLSLCPSIPSTTPKASAPSSRAPFPPTPSPESRLSSKPSFKPGSTVKPPKRSHAPSTTTTTSSSSSFTLTHLQPQPQPHPTPNQNPNLQTEPHHHLQSKPPPPTPTETQAICLTCVRCDNAVVATKADYFICGFLLKLDTYPPLPSLQTSPSPAKSQIWIAGQVARLKINGEASRFDFQNRGHWVTRRQKLFVPDLRMNCSSHDPGCRWRRAY